MNPREGEVSLAAVDEPSSDRPPETFWARARAFVTRHRSRLTRVLLLLVLLYAVTDLVSSTPQDVELVLPLAAMLTEGTEAGEGRRPDEVEVSILADDGQGLLSHARLRIPEDLENLHHEADLQPGRYQVVVEMRGVTPRRGSFEIPAEGAVRVHLSPEP